MVNVILKQNVKKKDMRQVTIKVQRTYTKQAEVIIELPDNILLEDVNDYLIDNEDLYIEKIEKGLDKAELSFHTDEFRYDVQETVTLTNHIWGGTL
jgi:preprotein translocase subunit SecA